MAVEDLSPLWLSLRISAVSTVMTAVLGPLLARILLTRSWRSRLILETIILCPLVLPPTVVGYALILLLGQQGPLASIAGGSWLFTERAAVVASIFVSLPLMYLSARAAFRHVDQHLIEVAHSFGARAWQSFLAIQIPLALPGLSAGILLAFARALGEFGATLMVAGNIPGQTQTLPIALYFDVEAGDYEKAGIWCLISLLVSGTIMGAVNFIGEKNKLRS